MVVVAKCIDLLEAQYLRISLASEGIASFIPDENTASIAPYLFFTGSSVRLMVDEENANQAKEIIAQERKQ